MSKGRRLVPVVEWAIPWWGQGNQHGARNIVGGVRVGVKGGYHSICLRYKLFRPRMGLINSAADCTRELKHYRRELCLAMAVVDLAGGCRQDLCRP